MHAVRPWFVLTLLACALMGAAGCSTMQRWLSRDESERHATRLQEVQLKVMRYADDYGGRMRDPLAALSGQSASPERRLDVQNWRITQTTAAYTIASGPNPLVNALDMVVLATLSRLVVEQYWQSAPDETQALLETHRSLERQAWLLVGGILNAEQTAELQWLLDLWRTEHPDVRAVSQVRFTDFAAIVGRSSTAAHGGGSLFGLIGLDPLGNLDPAVREIEQTRQLAERAIYYLQRAPNLLDMQVERLAYQLAVMPEAKQTLAGIDRVSFAAASLGQLSVDAPGILARERHAIFAELTATLHAEQGRMRELLGELNDVLKTGAQTSESVGATIVALDTFVARLQPKERPPTATGEPRRPFDITDYTQTAHELASTAQSLQALLVQLDASSAGVERLANATTEGLHEVVDRAFWRGMVLIAVLAFTALFVALAYRYALLHVRRTPPRPRHAGEIL
jgi:hypothetical protein